MKIITGLLVILIYRKGLKFRHGWELRSGHVIKYALEKKGHSSKILRGPTLARKIVPKNIRMCKRHLDVDMSVPKELGHL